MPSDEAQLEVIKVKLERVGSDIKDIKDSLDRNYVTREEFRPVRIFVYGLIGIALTAIGVSIVNLVVR